MNLRIRRALLLLAGSAFLPAVRAQASLLPASEAFRPAARWISPNLLEVAYRIAPGYSLYRERFEFAVEGGSGWIAAVDLPPARVSYDKVLQQTVGYYSGSIVVRISVAGLDRSATVVAKSQGCALDAGVCYPPQFQRVRAPAV